MEESKDIWVILDGYGKFVYQTYEVELSNFNGMLPEYYNLEKCEIIKNPVGIDGTIFTGKEPCQIVERNESKELVVRTLSRTECKNYWTFPHVPCH